MRYNSESGVPMRIVSLKEAQANLPSLIKELGARGEAVEIVEADVPLALLTPTRAALSEGALRESRASALASIRDLRQRIGSKMTPAEIRDAIEEGRP